MAGVQRLDPDLVSLDPLEVLQRVLEDGVPWLADTDAVAVALLRESLELLERAGRSGSVRDVIETQRLVISLLSQLGFSPTARARLGLAEIRTQGKLDEQRRKGPSE